ncbi:MAG: hypothetical protein KIT14_05395 [bacterium]|nr:hypothetical protein [bacterium]
MALTAVGACETCGVTFLAQPGHASSVREILRVHRNVCPGGDRSTEVVAPAETLPPTLRRS